MIVVAWGGARGRTGRLFGAARSRSSLRPDGGFFRSYSAAVIHDGQWMVYCANGKKKKQLLLRRESEAAKLDHPQTGASIRIIERKGWCFMLSLVSLRSHARVDRFSLIGLGLSNSFVFYPAFPSGTAALLFAEAIFCLAYPVPAVSLCFSLACRIKCNCPCLALFVGLGGTIFRCWYCRALVGRVIPSTGSRGKL